MNEAKLPTPDALKKIVQYLAKKAEDFQDYVGLDAPHDVAIGVIEDIIEDSKNKKLQSFWNGLNNNQHAEVFNMIHQYLINKDIEKNPDVFVGEKIKSIKYTLSPKPTGKSPVGSNLDKLVKYLAKESEDTMNYIGLDSPEQITFADFEDVVERDVKDVKIHKIWNSMNSKQQEKLYDRVVAVLEKKYGDEDEGNDYDEEIYDGSKLSKMLSKTAKKMMKENKSTPLMLNGKAVDEKSIEIDGIDRRDYPDFSDAYISAANYMDGTPLSDKEIEELDDQNNELVHEKIQDDQLYMQEGEEEKLGGSAYDKEDKEERGQYSNKPKMAGITFFNVPSGKESIATQYGLTQFKSSKWGIKHKIGRDYTGAVSAAEKIFGKGRYWEPRN